MRWKSLRSPTRFRPEWRVSVKDLSEKRSHRLRVDNLLISICSANLTWIFFIFRIIYVVCHDKVRLFSIDTGESIRDLDDNRDGAIVGLSINPENQKSLIACTANGTVVTWKLESYVIISRLVSILAWILFNVIRQLILYCRNSTSLHRIMLLDLSRPLSMTTYTVSSASKIKTTIFNLFL